MKRFVPILGLVTTFVGFWVLAHGHAQELACNAYAQRLGASASGLVCPKAVSTYLIGVALTTGGLIIVGLIGVAVVRQIRSRGSIERAPAIPTQQQYVIGTALGGDRPAATSWSASPHLSPSEPLVAPRANSA
jgi:Na+/glutamate symporter